MWGAAEQHLQKTAYGAGRYWGDSGLSDDGEGSPPQEESDDCGDLEDQEMASIRAYLMEGYLEEGRRRLGEHLSDTELLDGSALARLSASSFSSCSEPSFAQPHAPGHLPLGAAHAGTALPGLVRPPVLGKFVNTSDKVSLRLNKDLAATWASV